MRNSFNSMTNAPCAVGVLMKHDENMYSCVSQIQLYFKNQPFEKNAKNTNPKMHCRKSDFRKSEKNMQVRKAKNMQRKMQRMTCFFSVFCSFVLLFFFHFFFREKTRKNRTRFIFVFSNCFFAFAFSFAFVCHFQLSVFAFAFSFVFFCFSQLLFCLFFFSIAFFLRIT